MLPCIACLSSASRKGLVNNRAAGRRLKDDLEKFLVRRQIQGLLADVQALLYNFVRISLFWVIYRVFPQLTTNLSAFPWLLR